MASGSARTRTTAQRRRPEIAARGANVGREQGVADERRVADDVRQAVTGMSGRRDRAQAQRTDREFIAVIEQSVELAAVRDEVIAQPEHLLEVRLHVDDAASDRDRCTGGIVQVPGCAQMVGMRMGFQDPLDTQRTLPHEREHRVGAGRGRARGRGVVVQHRVDDRRDFAIAHDVRPRARVLVQEGFDFGMRWIDSRHACSPAARCVQCGATVSATS